MLPTKNIEDMDNNELKELALRLGIRLDWSDLTFSRFPRERIIRIIKIKSNGIRENKTDVQKEKAMKYADVPPGKIFFIEKTYSYPKLKTESGHIDIRDKLTSIHGSPDWDVELANDFVLAKAERDSSGYIIVKDCPFCHEQHLHKRNDFGLEKANCNQGEYILDFLNIQSLIKTGVVEYEAQDYFDKQWYPVNVLEHDIQRGKVKVEWQSTGFISWIKLDSLRVYEK